MKQNNETFTFSTQITNIKMALRDQDLTLSELLALHSTLVLLLMNNPEFKTTSKAMLNQIETRIIKAKSSYSARTPKLAEQLLNMINSAT